MRYVAFLRAINVGGRFVKMDRLRSIFEELPLSEVETFIASGNVIFTAASRSPRALEAKIGRHLEERLGYGVPVFLRTRAEVARVARLEPFGAAALGARGAEIFVGFMTAAPGAAAKRKVSELRSELDDFSVRGREVYWLRRGRSMQMLGIMARIERALGVPVTFRNGTTVGKLDARYA